MIRFTLFRCAVAAFLTLGCGGAAHAQQQEPVSGARVAAVRFDGVRALDEALLREATATRESRCRSILLLPVCALTDARWAEETAFLDPAELPRDQERIRALYAAWGYPNAAVTGRAVPRRGGTVEVVFTVAEGEPVLVRSVSVRGLEAVPEPVRLPQPLPLRPGEPFAQARIEATRRLITARLADLGYAFASVEVATQPEPAARLVDVVLEVRPGRVAVFGPTLVQAGPPISVDDVRRRLAYRPGDRFRPEALAHTAERLYRLPIVSRVFMDPLPAAGVDTVLVTTLGVVAGRTQGLQLGGSFSTATCLEGRVGWGHRYLFGAPRVFTATGGAANLLARPLRRFPCTDVGDGAFEELDYMVRAELREPVGADTWVTLMGAVSRESLPHAAIRRGVQARLGVAHMLTRELEAAVAYAPEQRDFLAAGPLFCGLHGVCRADPIQALATDATLAPLELSLAWSPQLTRRPVAAPLPGPAWMHPVPPPWLFTGRATLQAAGPPTASEFRFGSAVVEGTAALGRGRWSEAAGRLRAGVLFGGDEPLPAHVRLFGGGPLGVRGVAANRLGPAVLAVTPGQAAALGCEPVPGGCAGAVVDPRQVRLRPTGGTRLLEASLEGRRWVGQQLQLAAFVDVGAVFSGALAGAPAAVARSEWMWTPGVGALALSPFGPVRVDVAFNPSRARTYPLLMHSDELGEHLFLGNVAYDPFTFDDPARARELWRRLQFQFVMGLPF